MVPLAASTVTLVQLGGSFPRLLAATTAATANPTMWYATRAAAVCAYIALTE
jgi:hypothetical protein